MQALPHGQPFLQTFPLPGLLVGGDGMTFVGAEVERELAFITPSPFRQSHGASKVLAQIPRLAARAAASCGL